MDDDLEFHAWPVRDRGGQHIGTTRGGVLVVHTATGTAFISQSERSQIRNRANAVEQLRALLKLTGGR